MIYYLKLQLTSVILQLNIGKRSKFFVKKNQFCFKTFDTSYANKIVVIDIIGEEYFFNSYIAKNCKDVCLSYTWGS